MNKIKAEDTVACILSVMGAKTYGLLRTLVSPDKPKDKSIAQINEVLQNHLSPKPLIIAERFRFYKRDQKHGESVSDYITVIKRLAETCDFGAFLNFALRDKLVCGLRNENIQKRLLTESALTFPKGQNIAVSMEIAAKDSQELAQSRSSTAAESVNKLSGGGRRGERPKRQFQQKTTSSRCFRCNSDKHGPDKCYFKEKECYKCHKKGHAKVVCRAKTLHQIHPQEDRESDSDETVGVLKVKVDHSSDEPIYVSLQVENVNFKMELDTGASVSVIGIQQYRQYFSHLPLKKTRLRLQMYNKSVSHPRGVIQVEIWHKGGVHSLPLYVIDHGDQPLLGRNWLREIKLDWPKIKALRTVSNEKEKAAGIEAMKKKYASVFTPGCGKMKHIKASLKLKENAAPKFVKARPVPLAKKEKIDAVLDKLESEKIITKVSHSDWAAPIVTPAKKDGSVRVCGDFKVTINPQLDVDQYPLPRIEEMFANLAGGQQFTVIDLRQAYLQMEVDDEDQQFLTINTHRGLYRYCRLVYGIASAPAIWQRAMDQILQGLPMVQCYLDDIILTGRDVNEHMDNLSKVLERLQQYGLKANVEKCAFLKNQVHYLGHKIDANGLHKTDEKVNAVNDAPPPENVAQLRSFLGLVQYYHKFLPNLATVLQPLHQLLRTGQKWRWDQAHETAFKRVKKAMVSETVLAHFDPGKPLLLACDASPYGVGAVLSHVMEDGSERPIAFASRSLSTAEKNYAQIEREALGIVFGVKKFNQYLEGHKFTLITDNQPLLAIFHPRKGIPATAAARLIRWAVTLSGYSYDIVYRNTLLHANADALSRLPLKCTTGDKTAATFHVSVLESLPVTCSELREATRKDPVLVQVLQSARVGWCNSSEINPEIKPYFSRRSELGLFDGCILWGERVVVPEKLRKRILQDLHEGHLGIVKMKGLARSYVWWPGIDRDIEDIAKQCSGCQEIQRAPPLAPLHPWEFPSRPWKRIHVDFAGPFQDSMFLIVVDAHSKWPEVVAMKKTTTDRTINVLRDMFARWGIPEQLVSDNGPQFTSAEFEKFMKDNGVKHLRSAPYHPATNGLAERFVQSFKKAMKAAKSNASLSLRIAQFLFAYRNAPHALTGEAPAVLMQGRRLRSRLDMLKPDLQKKVEDKMLVPSKEPRVFEEDQEVMVRNYMNGPKWMKGTVMRRNGRLSYDVLVGSKVWKRHTDQIVDTGVSSEDNPTREFNQVPIMSPAWEPPQPVPAVNSGEVDNSNTELPPSPPARRYPVRERKETKRLIEE